LGGSSLSCGRSGLAFNGPMIEEVLTGTLAFCDVDPQRMGDEPRFAAAIYRAALDEDHAARRIQLSARRLTRCAVAFPSPEFVVCLHPYAVIVRRLRAKPKKKIVDSQAAIPSP
jgi:hypothetical protein